MIKLYGTENNKAYFIFDKKEVKSKNEAIEIVSRIRKERKDLFVASYANKITSNEYNVELSTGQYICVNRK